jgi:hypothetical protein
MNTEIDGKTQRRQAESIAHIMLEPEVFNWLHGVSVWQAPLQLHHCTAHVT